MLRSCLLRFTIVPLVIGIVLVFRWSLWAVLGPELPFLFLWPAVMLCAWLGGFGPGVLATVLSLTAADFFLIPPQFAFGPKPLTDWAGMGMFLFLGIALSWVVEFSHTAKRKVENYAQEVARQRQWFRVILMSIGDAVIATDTESRITFVNPVAQALTGWNLDVALGQPLEKVFAIINEQTRQVAENPVSRVLRDKAVVGLETHTALIAHDGTEVPIDDSAAPIQDEQGNLLGVVLVFRDITERKRTEEVLKEADRRKDEFLAMLAHELRNPLAPIRNAVQIMKLRGVDDPQMHWARDVVERQVQTMVRLVDDLLDVARISQGKITLRKERVDLATIVNRAVETTRPLMEERKHTLRVAVPPESTYLEVDPTRLEQVLTNLLNNAAKYTDPGGRISLTVRRHANEVDIRIQDTGIGIAQEILPRIFEIFVQAEQGKERCKGGLGVGLSLVRRLVEMHGGSVTAHSAGIGNGSEFVLRLPVLSATLAATDSEASLPSSPSPGHPRRVLVVDDYQDVAESMAALLRQGQHEVQVAVDGVSALEAAQTNRLDVILLDIGMPGMDGYEVARRLRGQPALQNTLLVALTGWGHEEDRHRSREAGFDLHLVKPVEPETLQALLAHPEKALEQASSGSASG